MSALAFTILRLGYLVLLWFFLYLIVRVMRRSGLPEEQVRQFVAAQADDRQRRRLAGEILLNNGSTQELRQKIGRLNPYYQARFQHPTP